MGEDNKDKVLRNFFKDIRIAFCISSITINVFKLMSLSGVEIIKYLIIKFSACFIISLYVALGKMFADYIYFCIKKNRTNEQINWHFG